MGQINIITVTQEQFEEIIDKKIQQLNDVLQEQTQAHVKHEDPLVDIASIKANLKWSDGKVRRLVREGKLQPEFTGNGKTMFFRLSQCTSL